MIVGFLARNRYILPSGLGLALALSLMWRMDAESVTVCVIFVTRQALQSILNMLNGLLDYPRS